MLDENGKINPVTLIQKLTVVEEKASAAHMRVDKMEFLIHTDLKDLRIDLKEMSKEVKDLLAWMNRGKGWSAAIMVFAGLLGGLISELISLFMRH